MARQWHGFAQAAKVRSSDFVPSTGSEQGFVPNGQAFQCNVALVPAVVLRGSAGTCSGWSGLSGFSAQGLQCGFDDVDDVIVGAHSHDVSIESRHGRHDAIGAQRHDDEQIQKCFVAFSQKQTDENRSAHGRHSENLVELGWRHVHDLAVAANAIQ